LYPLTKDFPKPLLKIGKKSILDRLIDDIDSFEDISEHIVISNHRFIEHFSEWKKSRKFNHKVTILDDGSVQNENRLGAVKDIAFAIEKCSVNEDIIVLAGDNILDFSLKPFIEYQRKVNTSVIMRHCEKSLQKLQKTGVVSIDESERVLEMQEKPKEPKSNWAVPPFYIYRKEDLTKITVAVKNNECGTDAPGDFIAWFCKNSPVHAWQMTGHRHDIGDLKSYEEAQSLNI
nr:nucleotidyltransferase family protein [Treponema sp.]